MSAAAISPTAAGAVVFTFAPPACTAANEVATVVAPEASSTLSILKIAKPSILDCPTKVPEAVIVETASLSIGQQ